MRNIGRTIRTLLGVCVLTLLLFGLGLFFFVSAISDSGFVQNDKADGIVALTGGQSRIQEALKLLAVGSGKRMLITGVNPTTTTKNLKSIMPNYGTLFECCVDIDKVAANTIGNAVATRKWTEDHKFQSLIVVTSSYHMPRSMVELRRALPNVELIPYPVTPSNFHIDAWWAYPGTARLVITEYLKFIPAIARLAMTRISGSVQPISAVPASADQKSF
ncbi:MAG: YdcF family protein [Methyloligellaceae bacterium]